MKLLLVVAVLLCVAQSQARDYRTQHDVARLRRGYPYPFPPGPPYGRKNNDTDVVSAKNHDNGVNKFSNYIENMLPHLTIRLQQLQIICHLFGWSNVARYLSYLITVLKLLSKNTQPILHPSLHLRERYSPECESKDPRPECHGYPR